VKLLKIDFRVPVGLQISMLSTVITIINKIIGTGIGTDINQFSTNYKKSHRSMRYIIIDNCTGQEIDQAATKGKDY